MQLYVVTASLSFGQPSGSGSEWPIMRKKLTVPVKKLLKKWRGKGLAEKKDKINFIPVRNLLCDPFRDGGRL